MPTTSLILDTDPDGMAIDGERGCMMWYVLQDNKDDEDEDYGRNKFTNTHTTAMICKFSLTSLRHFTVFW